MTDDQYTMLIDTDPGIDDALALLYALNRKEFSVQGITTVFGNCGVDTATRNALALVELAGGGGRIPVARGAEMPLTSNPHEWQARFTSATGARVHGANGVGGAQLPAHGTSAVMEDAVDFILDNVRRFPGELVIVALGPLTNLAAAALKDRRTMERLRGISFMGGTVKAPGNVTAVAEANVAGDPEAAEIVLGLDVPKTMVGLDVTMKTLLLPEDMRRLAAHRSPKTRFIEEACRHYANFYHSQNPDLPGFPAHDVLAFSCLVRSDAFQTVTAPTRVELRGEFTRGQIVADLRAYAPDDGPRCRICLDVEGRDVVEDFLNTMTQAGEAKEV